MEYNEYNCNERKNNMVRRVIHLKIMYLTLIRGWLLDLGMFTQAIHQLSVVNSFVDKVWLPLPTALQDKPVLVVNFLADLLAMFVLAALKR